APPASASSTPVISLPRSLPSGYAPDASTTVVAAEEANDGDAPDRSPADDTASSARRSLSSSGKTTWVSGSPNRQLNSSTLGPSSASMSPAYSSPTNGAPRFASSASTGRCTCSTSASASVAAIPGTGAYAPIPPVFGPSSRSNARVNSCADTGGMASLPSHNAKSETSGPSRSSSTTTSLPTPRRDLSASATSSSVRQTKTPFPAASPSAFTTHGGRASARRAAVGTPADTMTSFAKPFEPSILADAALGPKTRRPKRRSASATPMTSGASGPMTTRSTPSERESPSTPSASSA